MSCRSRRRNAPVTSTAAVEILEGRRLLSALGTGWPAFPVGEGGDDPPAKENDGTTAANTAGQSPDKQNQNRADNPPREPQQSESNNVTVPVYPVHDLEIDPDRIQEFGGFGGGGFGGGSE